MIFLCNRRASNIICMSHWIFTSKFSSDSICFRPLALKWNLVNCFARVTIYSRDIDHSFFLSASCTNWYTRFRRMSRKRNPQSPSIVTKRVNQNEARGKSHGRKPSSIALCTIDERHSELLKKKKKIRGKYISQRGLHPLLRRRRRQRGCAHVSRVPARDAQFSCWEVYRYARATTCTWCVQFKFKTPTRISFWATCTLQRSAR